MKESDLQKQILDYLRLKKCVAVKVGSGAFKVGDRFVRMGQRGVADILACCDGVFYAVEVKRKGKKPTPEQLAFLADVKKAGGVGIVANSLDDLKLDKG